MNAPLHNTGFLPGRMHEHPQGPPEQQGPITAYDGGRLAPFTLEDVYEPLFHDAFLRDAMPMLDDGAPAVLGSTTASRFHTPPFDYTFETGQSLDLDCSDNSSATFPAPPPPSELRNGKARPRLLDLSGPSRPAHAMSPPDSTLTDSFPLHLDSPMLDCAGPAPTHPTLRPRPQTPAAPSLNCSRPGPNPFSLTRLPTHHLENPPPQFPTQRRPRHLDLLSPHDTPAAPAAQFHPLPPAAAPFHPRQPYHPLWHPPSPDLPAQHHPLHLGPLHPDDTPLLRTGYRPFHPPAAPPLYPHHHDDQPVTLQPPTHLPAEPHPLYPHLHPQGSPSPPPPLPAPAQPALLHLPTPPPRSLNGLYNTPLDAPLHPTPSQSAPPHAPLTLPQPPLDALLDNPLLAAQLPRPPKRAARKPPTPIPPPLAPAAPPIAKPRHKKVRPKHHLDALQRHLNGLVDQVNALSLRNHRLDKRKHILEALVAAATEGEALAEGTRRAMDDHRAHPEGPPPCAAVAHLSWTPQEFIQYYKVQMGECSRWMLEADAAAAEGRPPPPEVLEAMRAVHRQTMAALFHACLGDAAFKARVMAAMHDDFAGSPADEEQHWDHVVAVMELTEGQVEDMLGLRDVYLDLIERMEAEQRKLQATVHEGSHHAAAATSIDQLHQLEEALLAKMAVIMRKNVNLSMLAGRVFYLDILNPLQVTKGAFHALPLLPDTCVLLNAIHVKYGQASDAPHLAPSEPPGLAAVRTCAAILELIGPGPPARRLPEVTIKADDDNDTGTPATSASTGDCLTS